MQKAWWQSKTVWVNVLALVVMLASGELGVKIPVEWAVPLLAIANTLLRIITTQPIGATAAPTQTSGV